uniref:Transcriptional adapter 3 n=1 Tax=Aceria tosichella TaxID=561515 RepID=A0A6G1SCJ2_9ACAR
MFSILQKSQDNVSAEDLEILQNEIERRLVDVVTERWRLERELETSNHLSPDTTSQPPPIISSVSNDCVSNPAKVPYSSSQPTSSLPSGKLRNSLKSRHIDSKFENASDGFKRSIYSSTNGNNNGVGDKKQIVKNEAPDKLWPFVEQFCATPTEEQIKSLEEMIKSMENDDEYYKIPDTLKKETPVSSTKDESSNNVGGTSNKNQKKSKQKAEDGTLLGALTQRLVSSLIVEADDNITDASRSSSDTTSSPPVKKRRSRSNKGIDPTTAKNFEKKVRQELEVQSILSQNDDIPYTSEEDENLRELLVYQHELLSIQTQNKLSMQILLKKAKRHTELEKERERLRETNADVIAAYKRLIQAKQRKRNPTKKEEEAAWKALKIHDVIFKKCDELYLTGLDRNNTS